MTRALLFLFLFAQSWIFAIGQDIARASQKSPYSYIYRVTNHEALQIHTKGWTKNNDYSIFHTKVDSFPSNKLMPDIEAVGHYVVVSIEETRVLAKLHSVNNVSVFFMGKKNLEFLVSDLQGNRLEDKEVRVGRKRIPFNEKTSSYKLKRQRYKGLVRVEHEGHLNLIEFSRGGRMGLFNRFISFLNRNTIVGEILPSAEFAVAFTVDFIDILGTRDFSWKFENLIDRAAYVLGIDEDSSPSHNHRGYLVFNKPQYRPGDTVRYKAFIYQKSGKPLKRPVGVYLHPRGIGQPKKIALLNCYAPGGYEGSFVLADSLELRLDQSHTLFLASPDGSRRYISGQFRYADYELKEAKLLVSAPKDFHYRGQDMLVEIRGLDENDLPLFDASLEVFVMTRKVNAFFNNEVFVPDTLMHQKLKLDPAPFKLIIPDSLFSNANIDYEVVVTLKTFDLQVLEKRKSLKFFHLQQKVDHLLHNGKITFHFRENGISKEVEGLMESLNANSVLIERKQVNLPFTIPLEPGVETYRFIYNGGAGLVSISKGEEQVSIVENRTAESVRFEVLNPLQVPFAWFVFKNDKEIASGEGSELVFEEPASKNDNYHLDIYYIWAGELQEERTLSVFQPKILNLTVNQPQMVVPGHKATIEIGVTDAFGKPVANTDITAFSWTSKFKESSPDFFMPNIRDYFPSSGGGYYFTKREKSGLYFIRDNADFWFRNAGLDTMLYYSYRFPGKDIFIQVVPNRTHTTQFAPYLFNGSWTLPVLAIYVNGVPVFTNIANNQRPYSFRGMPGKNTIRIRTRNQEIVIDDFYLEPGKKTIFSIDISKAQNVSVAKRPPRFTRAERKRLYPLHFAFEVPQLLSEAWIENNYDVISLQKAFRNQGPSPWYGQNTVVIGPVTGLSHAPLNLPSGNSYTVPLAPRFKQWITETGVIRLANFNERDVRSSWWNNGSPGFNEEVITSMLYKILQEEAAETVPVLQIQYSHGTSITSKGRGKMSVETQFPDDYFETHGFARAVILHHMGDLPSFYIFEPSKKIFHNLVPGKYQMAYVISDSVFFESPTFQVDANGLTNFRFSFDQEPAPNSKYLDFFKGRSYYKNVIRSKFTEDLSKSRHSGTFIGWASDYVFPQLSFMGSTNFIGRIIDQQTGDPVPFASVHIRGTTDGVIADIDGHFSLNVSASDVLVVSSIGYRSAEIPVAGRSSVLIVLDSDMVGLEEVIVVGYGINVRSALGERLSGVQISGSPSINRHFALGQGNLTGQTFTDLREKFGLGIIESPVFGFEIPDFTGWRGEMGEGGIRTRFSDYAYWQPSLRTNKEGKVSFEVTFPDDITQWNTYIYAATPKMEAGRHTSSIRALQPLSARLSLPRFLMVGDTAKALGRVVNLLPDTLETTAFFQLNDNEIFSRKHTVSTTAIDTLLLTAQSTDSLSVKYYIDYDGFVDGEERKIPVRQPGIEKTKGEFHHLLGERSLTIEFDPEIEKVELIATNTPVASLMEDIERLIKFPYSCNEQQASRLIALLVKRDILLSRGERFRQDALVKSTIKSLVDNQAGNGLWGWWGRSDNGNTWMSEHVLKALTMARDKGYEINYWQLPTGMARWHWENVSNVADKVNLLKIFKYFELDVSGEPYFDDLLALIDKSTTTRDFFFERTELDQLYGRLESDSLLMLRARKTALGNTFFEGRGAPYWIHGDVMHNTLSAYRILSRMKSPNQELLSSIVDYFLEVRDVSFPYNTYLTSNILYSFAASLSDRLLDTTPSELQLSGAVDSLVTEFPIKISFESGRPLDVKKTGSGKVYLTAYQTYFEVMPTNYEGQMKIETYFEGIAPGQPLEAGKEVTLIVNLTLQRPTNYLMLEVPIPAGCSYADNQNKSRVETHREQWRHQTTLFFNRLNSGKYTFEIKLVPRFSGVYTLNAAKAEMMYVPVINANNEIKKVEIR